MGIARLLAKGWLAVCLFAGAYALRLALLGGGELLIASSRVIVSMLLFAAMGLAFIGGYAASSGMQRFHDFRLRPKSLVPGFNEAVFAVFVLLSFLNQAAYAPHHMTGSVVGAFEAALAFAVPGHHAVADALHRCNLNGGREFGSAFAWLLAIVFACSAVSRLKLAAGVIRMERTLHPEALGPMAHAAVLGVAAIVAIQCFFVGSLVPFLPCGALAGVTGAVLIGLVPLLLAYLIFAALAALMASGSEK